MQSVQRAHRRHIPERAWIAAGLALCLLSSGCALPDSRSPASALPAGSEAAQVEAIYERAGIDQTTLLELEAERLRADLEEAEEAMVAIESGLRGGHGRAAAVSTLAESRIALERAARNAPWRTQRVQEAKQKLEEGERQFQAGHTGSAIFFASRARRIAAELNAEAQRVAKSPEARLINGQRVNLRAGPSMDYKVLHVLVDATPVFPERTEAGWVLVRTPSGQAGWVHDPLLREGWSPPFDTKTQSLPASFAR